MNDFKQSIEGTEFTFRPIWEGKDLVFNINAETHHFKMIKNELGNWYIWQQVPRWIKALELGLEKAIEEQRKKQTA